MSRARGAALNRKETEMAHIIIEKKYVKAISNFASKDYSRPILCGIHIVSKGGHTTLTATDCYILGEVAFDCDTNDDIDIIVDAKELNSLKCEKFGKGYFYSIETDDADDSLYKATANFKTWTTMNTVHGEYPDTARHLDAINFATGSTEVNAEFLERICKAAKSIGGRLAIVACNEKPNMLMATDGAATLRAVLMPVKMEAWAAEFSNEHKANTDGNNDQINMKARIAELEKDYELAQKHYDEACATVRDLEAKLAAEKEEHAMKDGAAHEWESKTLRWFDHEVEGARQCKKKGSKNFGMWFIPKVATA